MLTRTIRRSGWVGIFLSALLPVSYATGENLDNERLKRRRAMRPDGVTDRLIWIRCFGPQSAIYVGFMPALRDGVLLWCGFPGFHPGLLLVLSLREALIACRCPPLMGCWWIGLRRVEVRAFPPIAENAMDGAPGIELDRAEEMQVLRLTTPRLKYVWGPFRSG